MCIIDVCARLTLLVNIFQKTVHILSILADIKFNVCVCLKGYTEGSTEIQGFTSVGLSNFAYNYNVSLAHTSIIHITVIACASISDPNIKYRKKTSFNEWIKNKIVGFRFTFCYLYEKLAYNEMFKIAFYYKKTVIIKYDNIFSSFKHFGNKASISVVVYPISYMMLCRTF
jgi:hypothetical protein